MTYSPFLLILIPGLREAWRNSPDWVKGASIGGIVYLLEQLKANRFSGGTGFIGHRYPFEALNAAAAIPLGIVYVTQSDRPANTMRGCKSSLAEPSC